MNCSCCGAAKSGVKCLYCGSGGPSVYKRKKIVTTLEENDGFDFEKFIVFPLFFILFGVLCLLFMFGLGRPIFEGIAQDLNITWLEDLFTRYGMDLK